MDERTVQVTPPSALRSTTYAEIALPPFEEGACQASVTCEAPAVAVNAVGAVGSPTGLAVATFEYAPSPPTVTAATRNEYTTPAERFPTVKALAVVPVFAATVVHDDPPLEERSMR